jgi:hypothetical protein
MRRHEDRQLAVLALVLLALCAWLATGCGAGAIGQHARAALVLHHAHAGAVAAFEGARSASLDAVERAHPDDPAHDVELEAEAARWRPGALSLDLTGQAIRSYGEALQLARLADSADVALLDVIPIGVRAVALLASLLDLLRERGVVREALPPWVEGLLAIAGGGQ